MARKRTAKPATKAPAPAKPRSERRFNPLAAFGQIMPPLNGAVYDQDGGYFNANGDLLWEDHPATTVIETSEETVVTVDEKGEAKEETIVVTREVSAAPEGDPKQILTAWLKGEVELKHLEIVNHVKKAFGVVKRTKADVMAYLIDEVALVPAEQVKPKTV